MNNVSLVGRLTKDPDLRYTPNGVAVANFTIAVNRPFKKEGEKEADFIQGVVWRKLAENLANYMKKGNQIGVVGSIQTRNYEDDDGKRVYVTEVLASNIEFLEPRNSNSQHKQGQTQNKPPQNQKPDDPFADAGEPIDIDDDDLPF